MLLMYGFLLMFQDEEISVNKLQNMEYFEKFFCEVYRTHPVAPGYVFLD